MKPSPLRYERPASVAEAAALLAEHGWDAKALAGGQSLVPLLNLRLAAPAVVVDLNRVAGPGRASPRRTASSASARSCASARWSGTRRSSAAACWPRRCRSSGTSRPATAAPSAARSPTPTRPPSCRCACSPSAGRPSSRARAGGARSRPRDLFVTHLTSSLEPDEVLVEVRLPLDRAGHRRRLPGGRGAPRRLRLRARRLHARGRGRRGARGVAGGGRRVRPARRPARRGGGAGRRRPRRRAPRSRGRGGAGGRRSRATGCTRRRPTAATWSAC